MESFRQFLKLCFLLARYLGGIWSVVETFNGLRFDFFVCRSKSYSGRTFSGFVVEDAMLGACSDGLSELVCLCIHPSHGVIKRIFE